ncbi:hypothetical protein Desti_4498 [Desulfomonile tiedjei DSM 6799]|uniref:Uncharacterized protein n=1 Tax=Desulfomonile tiedjei (strain ATCC 49306 / DSM 6799 / DCB-1) TaxID=706587 RepID=I4CC38_DESTA|nr:hypothetical protein Desti_4498 [Desulfomonile tiedjei DSM 6799]
MKTPEFLNRGFPPYIKFLGRTQSVTWQNRAGSVYSKQLNVHGIEIVEYKNSI